MAADATGVDHRFILAVIMQESGGCVRAPTTNYGVRNPGLMQDHNGSGTCNENGNVQNRISGSFKYLIILRSITSRFLIIPLYDRLGRRQACRRRRRISVYTARKIGNSKSDSPLNTTRAGEDPEGGGMEDGRGRRTASGVAMLDGRGGRRRSGASELL